MENTRELAVSMLLEIMEKNRYSHLVIREVLSKYDYLDGREKAFMKRLVEGTLERRIQLDYVLNQFSKVPVSKMKPFIRNLLRMSVYQLLFMDKIPDSAVCNEAVKLAGKRGFRNLQGFINGVLRNVARKKEQIAYPMKDTDKKQYLSTMYSMPEWLVDKFIEERGEKRAEEIMKSFLEVSPVTVRSSESVSEEEKEVLLAKWQDAGISVKQHPYLPYAYLLSGTEGMKQLPGFLEGFCTVQDVSSMLVCEVAGIEPDMQVIDVCAAPGGKAAHVADRLGGTGHVSARDLTEYKVDLITDTINRLKLTNIEALVADASLFREEDREKADIVIADLPCSGLGIIGKKKDIKYHVTQESLEEVANLQRNILRVIWQYVKPGGVLVYSTCTVNPQENEENVAWFTENFPFEAEDISGYLPEELRNEGQNGMIQMLPGVHATDGFFIARLRRAL